MDTYPHEVAPGVKRLSFDTFEITQSVIDRWQLIASDEMWKRTMNDLAWTLCIARPWVYRGVLKPLVAAEWRRRGVEEPILKKGENE